MYSGETFQVLGWEEVSFILFTFRYTFKNAEVLKLIHNIAASENAPPTDNEEHETNIQSAMEQVKSFTSRVNSSLEIDEDPLWPVCRTTESEISQQSNKSLFSSSAGNSTHYGLLGTDSRDLPVYLNTEQPFAVVLFGNQGSGM